MAHHDQARLFLTLMLPGKATSFVTCHLQFWAENYHIIWLHLVFIGLLHQILQSQRHRLARQNLYSIPKRLLNELWWSVKPSSISNTWKLVTFFLPFSEFESFMDYFDSWVLSAGRFYVTASQMDDEVLGSILLYGSLTQWRIRKCYIARSVLFMGRFRCGNWNGDVWKDYWCLFSACSSWQPSCRRAEGICRLVHFLWGSLMASAVVLWPSIASL